MTENERQRFAVICAEINDENSSPDGGTIGTYSEKRLHRALKRFVCDNASLTEIPVGKYIADVFDGRRITEIQTGSLYPLGRKLGYYLENTEFDITVIHPVITEKSILRVELETGELLYKRRSPKHADIKDALSELYWISEYLSSPRINVIILFIRADEVRYSERMRYRKEGAYDSELYPREIVDSVLLSSVTDYGIFLPPELSEFTSSQYSSFIKLKGRRLYSALNLLCSLGLVTKERQKAQKNYIYKIT